MDDLPPLFHFVFPRTEHRFHWDMGMCDRLGVLAVLQRLQPDASLEIGTYRGGSLEVIARHSGAAYSIDIDPRVSEALRPHFGNVEFLVGDSKAMIPHALKAIEESGRALQFVLIDGDHSEERARNDIELVLRYEPRKPMCIVIHDSFNPTVRRGILKAPWATNPHVHAVGIDFVLGEASSDFGAGLKSRMWGGLALALLLPERRSGEVHLSQDAREQFEIAKKAFRE